MSSPVARSQARTAALADEIDATLKGALQGIDTLRTFIRETEEVMAAGERFCNYTQASSAS